MQRVWRRIGLLLMITLATAAAVTADLAVAQAGPQNDGNVQNKP